MWLQHAHGHGGVTMHVSTCIPRFYILGMAELIVLKFQRAGTDMICGFDKAMGASVHVRTCTPHLLFRVSACYAATPLLRSLVHRPQGVILVYVSHWLCAVIPYQCSDARVVLIFEIRSRNMTQRWRYLASLHLLPCHGTTSVFGWSVLRLK